jgi:hypothetical protein
MSKNVAPVSRTVFNKLDRASSAIRLCLASGVGIVGDAFATALSKSGRSVK